MGDERPEILHFRAFPQWFSRGQVSEKVSYLYLFLYPGYCRPITKWQKLLPRSFPCGAIGCLLVWEEFLRILLLTSAGAPRPQQMPKVTTPLPQQTPKVATCMPQQMSKVTRPLPQLTPQIVTPLPPQMSKVATFFPQWMSKITMPFASTDTQSGNALAATDTESCDALVSMDAQSATTDTQSGCCPQIN